VIESNISIEYRRQKEAGELRKKSSHIGKEVDKVAGELDSLKEQASSLQEEIRRCDSAEMVMIADFDRWIVYYNEVAASRMKELQKKVKEIRKRRAECLEELAKIRPKISLLESRCEALSYRQGELRWESMMQGVKGRKWKAP
jgi:chromosome segregation ATPase